MFDIMVNMYYNEYTKIILGRRVFMKKILSLVLSVLMIFALVSLAGCGKEKTLKLGFGVYSALSEVKNADG